MLLMPQSSTDVCGQALAQAEKSELSLQHFERTIAVTASLKSEAAPEAAVGTRQRAADTPVVKLAPQAVSSAYEIPLLMGIAATAGFSVATVAILVAMASRRAL
jgi:hypothetical protein